MGTAPSQLNKRLAVTHHTAGELAGSVANDYERQDEELRQEELQNRRNEVHNE